MTFLQLFLNLFIFYTLTISQCSACDYHEQRGWMKQCEDKQINDFLREAGSTTPKPKTTTKSLLERFPVVNQWPSLKIYPKREDLLKDVKQKIDIERARRPSSHDCKEC